ncbi:MAG: DUF2855 family protein [Thermoleophilaceae bacterium]|nr:DUF2855 family protein [Thermoleophilaceae bacterium]
MPITDFLVARDDIARTKTAAREFPVLGDGEVLLELERFGLSANNITYATLGDAMGYWRFFPAEEGWGSVPVWGHAHVVGSHCAGIEPGMRYFGYYPLSTHLVVKPERVTPNGFVDGAAHRAELPAVYQRYMLVPEDSEVGGNAEDQQSLWRPLFLTSFGAADFIEENGAFEAGVVVFTSASSKTALGTAFCLNRIAGALELVGLTSAANVEFCESTDYYDRVVSYDDLSAIGEKPFILIDFAGNGAVLDAIEEFAGDRLLRTIIVGGTHWEDRERSLTAMSAGTELFFLPTWIVKRSEDWGPTSFMERGEAEWEVFAPTTETWLTLEEHTGLEGIENAYQLVLAGESRPDVGHILEFG